MNRIQLYKIIFTVLSVSFMLDAFYLHQLIPWNSPTQHRGRINHTSNMDPISHKTRPDIRTISTLNNNLPYLPSRRKSKEEKPTIPHIIHQTWDTEEIPELFHKWIVTWHRDNPDWEYWFWTLSEIRRMITFEYPHFLGMYDTYTADIFRSDALRYLVLYKYGGIYLDLDMESLKPLDNWTYGYQCIVSEETYAHPFVVREEKPPANIVNGFIATRPGHPMLKLAVDLLEEFAGYYFGDYLHATGPHFFDAILRKYLKSEEYEMGATNDVTVVPPKYFVPTYDPSESDILSKRCYPGYAEPLSVAAQLTCAELQDIFLRRTPSPQSFTDHHWVHAYMFHPDWKEKDTKSILNIVPKVVTSHVYQMIDVKT